MFGSLLLLSLLTIVPHGESFVSLSPPSFVVRKTSTALKDVKDDLLEDLSNKVSSAVESAAKGFAKQATDKITELTGKEDVVELAKILDQKARATVADWTDKEETDFGDLIKLADSKVKDLMANMEAKEEWKKVKELSTMAGKEVQSRLAGLTDKDPDDFKEVQEVATKEIVSILQSRQYGIGDLFFLLKLCTSFGLGMNPAVMAIFPLNVLIQLYNLSLIQEAGKGVVTAVALELDKRARNVLALELNKRTKTALFGSADVEVGSLFKKAILDSLGKSEYNFGDIARNVLNQLDNKDDDAAAKPIGVAEEGGNVEVLDAELEAELVAIDKALEVEEEEDDSSAYDE